MEPHPERLGRYRLGRELGRGGQATVHEAVAEPDGARVAIKRLLLRRLLQDPAALDRLRREVAAARAVQHPGLVRALDVGLADDGSPYVVFELVAGGRPITRAFAGHPPLERVALVRDAARALGALHQAGLVHRDVTPANVLVDEGGAVRVTDLGLAWVPGEVSLTRTGDVLGTRGALAPEVALEGTKGATSPRVDVWGLGLLLFEALAGAPPPPAPPGQGPPGPAALSPSVPPALDAVCRRALAVRPEERFPDGDALAAALDEAARSLVGVGQELGAGRPSGRHPSARLTTRRLRPGARLGRFVLGERLGDGGMGEVWRARDAELGRDVAVKVLRASPGAPADPDGVGEARRRRFLREQQAAARVRHHGVVAVHDAGEADGVSWLAMDLVEGEPLDARLRRGPLEVDEALWLGAACARAVQALHEAGVLHRDIKPANILLDREGNPRLTDFGVAALEGADALTRTGQSIGTPLYMAPEQLAGQEVDGRADVYALGAVLWEALAGRPAWTAHTFLELAAAKSHPPERPSQARRSISSTASGSGSQVDAPRRTSAVGAAALAALADEVVLRALAPEPGQRPPTAGALADALEQALAGQGAARRGGAVGPLVATLLAGLAVLALVVGLGAALHGRPAAAPASPVDLLALRRRVEGEAGEAPRLAGLSPELEAALDGAVGAVGSGAPPGDARALAELRAWLGLLALARGDAARAARLAPADPPAGPAQHALRGGLLARSGDPADALRALDAAARAGLEPLEARRWRALALARKGVERTEAPGAQPLVAALRAASKAPDDEEGRAAAELEVACLAAAGKRAEADAALRRLADPRPELRWDVAVLVAADQLAERGPVAARDGLARAARPARPALQREADVARRALEHLRARALKGGSLPYEDSLALIADLELAARLDPERPLPRAVMQELLQCIRVSVISGSSLGMQVLILEVAAACPADEVIQAECAEGLFAMRFSDGNYLVVDGPLERRYVEAGLRAAGVCRGLYQATAHVVALSGQVNLGDLDGATRTVAEVSAALAEADRARVFGADGVRGPLLVLRARLSARRGNVEAAMALLDQAASLVPPRHVGFARLDVLRAAGHDAELVELAVQSAATQTETDDQTLTVGVLELVWPVLARAGLWAELVAFLGRRLDASPPDQSPVTRLRLVHALLQTGDRAGAAARAERVSGFSELPEDLAERLRAGDPDVEATIRRLVGQ